MRRDGRNSDCHWPGESPVRATDPRHLSADAEFAEDLAIRYADVHHGLRTPNYVSREAYEAARDGCMARLFQEIAREHGVRVEQVSAALGRNRERIDLAINLPFVLLCCIAAAGIARVIWIRYPPADHGWMAGALMTLFLSVVFAIGSVLLGELWAWTAESYRIGNGHMSYRLQRLPWAHHRSVLFAGSVAVFWAAATLRFRLRR